MHARTQARSHTYTPTREPQVSQLHTTSESHLSDHLLGPFYCCGWRKSRAGFMSMWHMTVAQVPVLQKSPATVLMLCCCLLYILNSFWTSDPARHHKLCNQSWEKYIMFCRMMLTPDCVRWGYSYRYPSFHLFYCIIPPSIFWWLNLYFYIIKVVSIAFCSITILKSCIVDWLKLFSYYVWE